MKWCVDLLIAALLLAAPVLTALSFAGRLAPGAVDACMVAWVALLWLDAEFKSKGEADVSRLRWPGRLLLVWGVLSCGATVVHTCAHNLPLGVLACMSAVWLLRLEAASSCLQQADDANRRIVMRLLNTRSLAALQAYQDELAAVAAEVGVHVSLQRAMSDHRAVQRAFEQVKEQAEGTA